MTLITAAQCQKLLENGRAQRDAILRIESPWMSSFSVIRRRVRRLLDSGRPATRPPAQYEVMP
jgi:hypothetical protein